MRESDSTAEPRVPVSADHERSAGQGSFRAREFTRIAIVAFLVLAAYFLQGLPLLKAFENRLYDRAVRFSATQHVVSPEIVLIAIDEYSLQALEPAVGRWPWPRAVLASVIDYCSEAKVIAVDILFPEGDWQYQSSDDLLVETVASCSNVVNAIHLNLRPPERKLPDDLLAFSLPGLLGSWNSPIRYASVLHPFDKLLAAGVGVGHVNPVFDEDGVCRSYAMLARARGHVFPSLALSSVMRYRGLPLSGLRADARNRVKVGPHRIPLNKQGCFRLRPSKWQYRSHRIADVISAWTDESNDQQPLIRRSDFKDKIVVIGSLATGLLEDMKVTSMSSETGGVEIVTTAIENILHGRWMTPLPGASFLLIAVLSLLPASRRLARPLTMFLGVMSLAVFYLVLSVAALLNLNVVLPLTGPLLGLALSAIVLSAVFWYEERCRRERVESLEEAKEELTAMVVHDLRNALAPVVMGLGMAEESADDEFLKRSFLPIVKDSSDQLLCQINAILDMRRMEEGQLRIEKEAVDPDALLRDMEREYRLAAMRWDKSLHLLPGEHAGIQLFADADVVKRILRNLIWNAIKYSKPSSTVECGWAVRDRNSGIDLLVRNHGECVPADRQQDIFTTTPTAGKAAKAPRGFHSSGLGLPFCRMAAEAHGGSIRMDSPCPAYGDGVEVTVSFPPRSG